MEELRRVFYPQPSDSGNITIYYCGHEHCRKNYRFGPAIRNHYIIHHIVRGSGVIEMEKIRHDVHAGQLFIIKPYVTATYQADAENPWEYYWVGFDGGESIDLVTDAGFSDTSPVITASNPIAVTDCLYQMSDIHTRDTPNRLMMISLLYRFFSELHIPEAVDEGHRYVSAAIQYIFNNYQYPISIAEIASRVGISRSHLYRLFIEKRGISPQQYLITHRMLSARDMLYDGRYSVNEIVYSCGFSTPSRFFKLFKERYGKSPLQYQKSLEYTSG